MKIHRTLVALALAAGAAAAHGQGYPARPVRIVVPYAAGGAVDVVTRKAAQQLTLQSGQTFIVENKPGATGTIGAGLVADAAPDGYTLMANDTTYSLLPFIFKSLPWNPETGLRPVSAFMFAPMAVVVVADSPYRTLSDLLNAARAHPGRITFGSGGNGSSPHFSTEALKMATGTDMQHIPFKGAGEATVALMTRTIDFQIASTPGVMAQVKSGRVRLLAISGDARLAELPDVPTFREAGVDQSGVINFTGLWAPQHTPAAVLDQLQALLAQAMQSDGMRRFAADLGAEPRAIGRDQFARLLAGNNQVWQAVAKEINLQRQ